MFGKLALVSLAVQAGLASSHPHTCPSVSGTKSIEGYQLYPENADFDTRRCLLYTSVLYNSTAVAWDPCRNDIVHTFEAPGLSGNPLFHSSGVRVDHFGRLSVVINAGAAFNTGGKDISGDNFLVKFDLQDQRLLWRANITKATNGAYSGYQDSEDDDVGNTFVLGSFPSSLIKVSPDGKSAIPWYVADPATRSVHGFTGIARHNDFFIVSDNTGQLYRFDFRAPKGKPIHIPLWKDTKPLGKGLDGILLPSIYHGTVLLVTDHNRGTVVLRSKDGKWTSAENLGAVPNPYLSQGGETVAAVQISDSIYSLSEYFADSVDGRPGNRTKFPLRDITQEVKNLLKT